MKDKKCKTCGQTIAAHHFGVGETDCRNCRNRKNGGEKTRPFNAKKTEKTAAKKPIFDDRCICSICGKPRTRDGKTVFHDKCKSDFDVKMTLADVKERRLP